MRRDGKRRERKGTDDDVGRFGLKVELRGGQGGGVPLVEFDEAPGSDDKAGGLCGIPEKMDAIVFGIHQVGVYTLRSPFSFIPTSFDFSISHRDDKL